MLSGAYWLMSDYISHIVEQSMGIAASVQPLIAPVFAPSSFSTFISPDDMMQEPHDSAAEAAEAPLIASSALPEILAVPPHSALIKAVEPQFPQDTGDTGRGDKPLTGTINRSLQMEHTLSQPHPTPEGQSAQPTVQPLQREPVSQSQASLTSLSPREELTVGDDAPPQQALLTEQPRTEGKFHRPTFLAEDTSTAHDQSAIAAAQPHDDLDQFVTLHSKEESPTLRRGVGLSRPLPEMRTFARAEQAHAPTKPPAMDVVRRWAGQSLHLSEELAGETGLPVPASGQSIAAPDQPLPTQTSVPQRPEIMARSDERVQEAYATAKTNEVTVADHVPPRKQSSHDSYPLDALLQQQSAYYPSLLLPREISLPASQSGAENGRYATATTGNERASLAVLDQRDELPSRQNSQRQPPASGYDGNLAPEPDAQQRLLTRTARHNDDANESEPLIRVSIGRVEVRATTSPAAPAKKRAASTAPALSLSDYLKRRKGGAG
jgi:hypothetical protein